MDQRYVHRAIGELNVCNFENFDCRQRIILEMLPSGVRTQIPVQKTLVQTCRGTRPRREAEHVVRCVRGDVDSSLRHKVLVALACGILTTNTGLGVEDAQALLASPNTQIPRSAEAALRRSIPAFNDNVFELQKELESVQYKLRIPQRKPWQDMLISAENALRILSNQSLILQGVLDGDEQDALELL